MILIHTPPGLIVTPYNYARESGRKQFRGGGEFKYFVQNLTMIP